MSILDDEDDLIKISEENLIKECAKKWYLEHSEPSSLLNDNDDYTGYAFVKYFDIYKNQQILESVATVKIEYKNNRVIITPYDDRFPIYLKDVDKVPEYIIIKSDYFLKVDKDDRLVGEFQKFRS